MSTPLPRRAARGQSLPDETALRLRSLIPHSILFYAEVEALYNVGWPLRAIGEAFDPPVTRSTVHAWLSNAPSTPLTTVSEDLVPRPTPKTPPVYVRKTPPPPPPVPAFLATRLQTLAPIAQRYRSGMDPASAPAQANVEMTGIVKRLHTVGNHTIAQIAQAALVSPRAIRKRLNK